MLPSPRLASLSALPRGNGDAMSKVSSKADDAAPANAVLSGCVDACVGDAQGQLAVRLRYVQISMGSELTVIQRHLQQLMRANEIQAAGGSRSITASSTC